MVVVEEMLRVVAVAVIEVVVAGMMWWVMRRRRGRIDGMSDSARMKIDIKTTTRKGVRFELVLAVGIAGHGVRVTFAAARSKLLVGLSWRWRRWRGILPLEW